MDQLRRWPQITEKWVSNVTLFSLYPTSLTRLRAGRSDGRGSIPCGGWEFFSSPPRPDRLSDPPSLLSNGYQELLPRG